MVGVALPRSAPVGVVGEAVAARGEQTGGEVLGRFGRITVPPSGGEELDVSGLESADLDAGDHLVIVLGEDVEHLPERHGAIA